MSLTFKVFNLDTEAFVADLVDIVQPKVNFEYPDGFGSLQFEYPVNGRNFASLANDCEVVAYWNDVEIPNGRFIVRGVAGEEVSDDKNDVKFTGLSFLDAWRKVVVYTPIVFGTATPGKILRDLDSIATSRGAWGAVAIDTTSFNNTTDSDGQAWNVTLNIEYKQGAKYLDILRSLATRGLIDVRMEGRSLHVYNGNSYGDHLDVTLAAGLNLSETPFKRSTEDRFSHVVVGGEEGVSVQRTGTGPRREEAFVSQSGVSDIGTLNVIGDSFLQSAQIERDQRTVKLAAGSSIIPGVTIQTGDWIILHATDPEEVRVRQMVLAIDKNQVVESSLVLNDRILEGDLKRAYQLLAVSGGTTGDGGSIGTPNQPTPGSDSIAPKAPTDLQATSAAYTREDGATFAAVSLNWLAPTENTDNSPLTDFSHYIVYMRPDGSSEPRQAIDRTTDEVHFSSEYMPNVFYRFSVTAVDQNGNTSAYSTELVHLMEDDNTPPPKPSQPTVSPYLGQIKIVWDGLDHNGQPQPPDFKHLEVHVSTVTGFTPDASTMISVLTEPGIAFATDLVYNTPYYVRFVAVDNRDNASEPSDQSSATPEFVTGGDIAAGEISYETLAFQQWGNLIPDGSFETQAYRDRAGTQAAVTGGQYSFRTDAATNFGFAYLRGHATVGSGVRDYFLLAPDYGEAGPVAHAFRVIPEGTLLARSMIKSISGNGEAGLALRWYDRDGTFMSDSTLLLTSTGGNWQQASNYLDVPEFAVWAVPVVRMLGTATTGTWDFDAIEFREVANAWLVKTAAIITAKIADLAVTNAKIANLAVGKLTAGSLTADVTVSGRFATALSGQRMEINSTGLHSFNSGGVETVHIANTGSAFFMGEIYSGVPGTKRIRIDANATFNNEAGITFERGTGSDAFQPTVFAHYNTFDGASGGGMHVMSAEATANSSGRAELNLYRGGSFQLRSIFGSGQLGIVEASGELRLYAGGIIDIDAGTSSNILFYGRHPVNTGVLSTQSIFQTHDSIGGTTTGYTIAYGPTMASLPFVYPAPSPNANIRYRITTLSTTQYGLTYDSVAGSNWRFIVMRT